MKNHAAIEMPARANGRHTGENAFGFFHDIAASVVRIFAVEPLFIESIDKDRTVEDTGPDEVSGVEVWMRYDNCFEAAFGFDLSDKVQRRSINMKPHRLVGKVE